MKMLLVCVIAMLASASLTSAIQLGSGSEMMGQPLAQPSFLARFDGLLKPAANVLEELSQANDEMSVTMSQQDAVYQSLAQSADELFRAYDDAAAGVIAEQSMNRRALGANFFQLAGIKKAVIADVKKIGEIDEGIGYCRKRSDRIANLILGLRKQIAADPSWMMGSRWRGQMMRLLSTVKDATDLSRIVPKTKAQIRRHLRLSNGPVKDIANVLAQEQEIFNAELDVQATVGVLPGFSTMQDIVQRAIQKKRVARGIKQALKGEATVSLSDRLEARRARRARRSGRSSKRSSRGPKGKSLLETAAPVAVAAESKQQDGLDALSEQVRAIAENIKHPY